MSPNMVAVAIVVAIGIYCCVMSFRDTKKMIVRIAEEKKRTSYTWAEFMNDIETGVSIDEIHAACKEFGMPRRPVTTSVPYQWIGTNVPFVGFNTPWTPSITTISSASTASFRIDSSNQ